MKWTEARQVVAGLYEEWKRATDGAKMLDQWYRNTNSALDLSMPSKQKSSWEYKGLAEVSRTGYADSIVTAVSQQIIVEDHRLTSSAESSKVFKETWRPNGMPARQLAVHRGANALSESYVTTLPGTLPGTKKFLPVIRGESATKMLAFFDETTDEFAIYALWGDTERVADGRVRWRFRLYDDQDIFFFSSEEPAADALKFQFDGMMTHDTGIPPVHRFAPRLDLEGRAVGDIQRVLPVLRRLDQDVFDRMIVQRFASWKVRWATGLTKPQTPEDQAAAELALRVNDFLIGQGEKTRFGTLDASDLLQFIKAKDADERALSAISQVPAYQIAGTVENVSADGLAMMQAGLARHAEEIRVSFGQTWDQVQRTCAYMLAKNADSASERDEYLNIAQDYETTTIWRDTEIRSLAHAADALGKLSTQLGIPPEVLWRRIPGWQKIDEDRARELLSESQMLLQLQQIIGDATDEAIARGTDTPRPPVAA